MSDILHSNEICTQILNGKSKYIYVYLVNDRWYWNVCNSIRIFLQEKPGQSAVGRILTTECVYYLKAGVSSLESGSELILVVVKKDRDLENPL